MKYSRYACLALIFALFGCFDTPPPNFPEGEVVGYKPVYLNEINNQIELVDSRAIENPGQIYLIGDVLLLNDVGKGIHIIDNSDPANPINEGFLRVVGSENLALRNGILYINQFNTLLAVDVSDPEHIQVISRNLDVLKTNDFDSRIPPQSGYYFECPDDSKGTLVGWELTTINSPKCYR